MPEQISAQIKRLVAENETRQAAERLLAQFQGRNEQLAKLALVQLNNLKRLLDQTAAGVLSQAEIGLEQNKINQALLYLADEHARLYESGKPAQTASRRPYAWLAGAAALALLAFGAYYLGGRPTAMPGSFDLEVRLHGPQGEQDPLRDGRVNVRLGQTTPQEAKTLDAEGRAWFRELGEKYVHDTISLIFFPGKGRYQVISQSAYTAAESKTIRFTLDVLPENTLVRYALRGKKGPLSGATVTIDGKLTARTDEKGYFELAVPKAAGAQAHFLIEKDGKRLFEQDLTLSPEFNTLPVE